MCSLETKNISYYIILQKYIVETEIWLGFYRVNIRCKYSKQYTKLFGMFYFKCRLLCGERCPAQQDLPFSPSSGSGARVWASHRWPALENRSGEAAGSRVSRTMPGRAI